MDETDRRLLALLRQNARRPVASLAHELGISRATVQHHIDRLLECGEILGFTVRMKSEETSRGIRALALIEDRAKDVNTVIRALRRIPEAHAIYTTNGRWDLIVEMVAETLAALDEAISAIRKIDGIVSTETMILLTPH